MKEENMPEIPEEFASLMVSTFGEEEGKALVEGLRTPPSVSLRVNRSKLGRCGWKPEEWEALYPGMEPVEWAAGGFRLKDRPVFTANPMLHAGGFYVQDAASMYLSSLLEGRLPQRPLTALDLCAAPGGKSIALTEMLPEGSLLVSNEVVPARAAVLAENMTKWGWPGRIVTSGEARRFGEMEDCFDLIVVDAPCSGEGMMRKESVARSQWSEGLVRNCQALQREILEDVLPALRPGGLLVYSTCTFNRMEDEENVEWLVEKCGLELVVPGRRFTPHRDGTEGLFIALLRKEGDPDGSVARPSASAKKGGGKKGSGARGKAGRNDGEKLPPEIREWVRGDGDIEFSIIDERILAESPLTRRMAEGLPETIRVLSRGVEVGEYKGKDFQPSHNLAMSPWLRRDAFPTVELGDEEALRFLRRDGVSLQDGTPKGYLLLTWRNLPLGWAKNLGPRANILYPKEWRIRAL